MQIMTSTPGSSQPTKMSSREIAELTGKQHQHVKRDIEAMLTELKEDVSSFGRIYLDSMNRQQTEYLLDRELTETLLTGYSAVLRRKVITRWHELEAKPAAIDQQEILRDPAAMRGLLLGYTEKVLELESKVDELSPKAAALDRIATFSDGSYGMRDAAKVQQVPERKFIQYLDSHQWIYQQAPGQWRVYAEARKSGLMEQKTTTGQKPDGTEWQSVQVRVTAKGMAKLAQAFEREGVPA